jgi:hypothetical protein
MMQFVLTLCLLGVVLVGLLLMMSAISLEQAGAVLARGIVAVALIVWATCLVERLVALLFEAVLVAIHGIVIAALVIGGLIIFTAFIVRLTRRRQIVKEMTYETNKKGLDNETD